MKVSVEVIEGNNFRVLLVFNTQFDFKSSQKSG